MNKRGKNGYFPAIRTNRHDFIKELSTEILSSTPLLNDF